MASDSVQAEAHRDRQALRPRAHTLVKNEVDWLHGELIRNRHERRAALAAARRFGCDPNGDHDPRCGKYVERKKKREVVS